MTILMWLACGGGLDLTTDATTTGSGNQPPAQNWSISATIDGTTVTVTSPPDGSALAVSQITSAIDEAFVEGQTFGIGLPPILPRMEIQAIAHFNDLPDDTDRFHILDVGSMPYGTLIQNGGDDPVESPGVNIKYWDATGAYWNCSKSAGSQAASWFEITSHEDYDGEPLPDGTQPRAVTEGFFYCSLYNESGGFVDLEDGTFTSLTTTW